MILGTAGGAPTMQEKPMDSSLFLYTVGTFVLETFLYDPIFRDYKQVK